MKQTQEGNTGPAALISATIQPVAITRSLKVGRAVRMKVWPARFVVDKHVHASGSRADQARCNAEDSKQQVRSRDEGASQLDNQQAKIEMSIINAVIFG